jgi:hypothetical protein
MYLIESNNDKERQDPGGINKNITERTNPGGDEELMELIGNGIKNSQPCGIHKKIPR